MHFVPRVLPQLFIFVAVLRHGCCRSIKRQGMPKRMLRATSTTSATRCSPVVEPVVEFVVAVFPIFSQMPRCLPQSCFPIALENIQSYIPIVPDIPNEGRLINRR